MSSFTGGKPKSGERDRAHGCGGKISPPREEGCGGGTRAQTRCRRDPRPPRPQSSAPPRPAPRSPPRPAPPGRGPARLAARRDHRQVRPRGERVRGARARAQATEASELSPVQPPLPHLRPAPPEPVQCRPNSDRLEGTWSRAMGPGPGTGCGGRGAGLPGRTRFCSWSRRPEAAIVCAPSRRVGPDQAGRGVGAPPGAVRRAGPRGLRGPGAGAPGGATLRGERGGTGWVHLGPAPRTGAGDRGGARTPSRAAPSMQEGGRVRTGKPG